MNLCIVSRFGAVFNDERCPFVGVGLYAELAESVNLQQWPAAQSRVTSFLVSTPLAAPTQGGERKVGMQN